MTDTIEQRERVQPQRSFTAPYGDTRRDFPPPDGAVLSGYPSTATTANTMTQPTVPRVGPISPRKLR